MIGARKPFLLGPNFPLSRGPPPLMLRSMRGAGRGEPFAPERGLGLASALIARALGALAGSGVEEAELGVDSRNGNSAFELYSKLGYRTESVDSWCRKPL
jgi:hypothetical protein